MVKKEKAPIKKKETKIPSKKEEQTVTVKKDNIEVIEKKPEKEEYDDDDEDVESLVLNKGTSSTFRYPLRRGVAPSIRIQPSSTPLEITLGDIEIPTKKEENKDDLYKPLNMDKNYSLNQKYELPGAGGSSSYSSFASKTLTSQTSPSLTPNFSNQMDASRGFGNTGGTPGYPGQESNDRKYDSGLEQQTQNQDKRRRDM